MDSPSSAAGGRRTAGVDSLIRMLLIVIIFADQLLYFCNATWYFTCYLTTGFAQRARRRRCGPIPSLPSRRADSVSEPVPGRRDRRGIGRVRRLWVRGGRC